VSPVVLVEYDPRWPKAFAIERDLLVRALGAVAIDIQHVGSTAVVKMVSKPITDILVGVAKVPIAPAAVNAVCALGYVHKGENGLPGHHYFSRLDRHVHVVEHDSISWVDTLLFRDFLRGHPEVALEYASLKRELARRHTRDDYTLAKAPFIIDVIARARAGVAKLAAKP